MDMDVAEAPIPGDVSRTARSGVSSRRRRRPLVPLPVSLEERLRRGVEPSILQRVDLDQLDDREDGASPQDLRWPVELGCG